MWKCVTHTVYAVIVDVLVFALLVMFIFVFIDYSCISSNLERVHISQVFLVLHAAVIPRYRFQKGAFFHSALLEGVRERGGHSVIK